MLSDSRVLGNSADARAVIEEFLRKCAEPAILEPGEELLLLTGDNFALETRGSRLTLQAWDLTRNFTRRILNVKQPSAARLEVTVEHFPKREGQLFLLDLANRKSAGLARRTSKMVFRERFRLLLRRQFADWTLAELTAEANLEHSLSPSFPRALLRHGQHAWAAIACPPDGDPNALLTFGLIWLSYLRAREQNTAVATVIQGLALYLPSGRHRSTALRLHQLDPAAARFELYTYTEEDSVSRTDPKDHGNLDTSLEPCRRPPPNQADAWRSLHDLPGVEVIHKHDGRASLRVHGVEFAEQSGGSLRFGLTDRRPAREQHLPEIERLVGELTRARSAGAPDRDHPLFRQFPEAWLESQVRADIETVDASLRREPIYGQVPAFTAGDRGIMDLLAVDHSGRLAVLELKASADPHLPMQALDYWLRVKWHLDRGEFAKYGYFPGIALRPDPPRLLLVSPCLEFHPSTETILSYFPQSIAVERVGLALEWRKGLQVMFRLRGAQRPLQ